MKQKDLELGLLERGKKRGVLTFEELNETFPAEYCQLARTERFLRRLEHLGIRVVEGKRHGKTRAHRRHAA